MEVTQVGGSRVVRKTRSSSTSTPVKVEFAEDVLEQVRFGPMMKDFFATQKRKKSPRKIKRRRTVASSSYPKEIPKVEIVVIDSDSDDGKINDTLNELGSDEPNSEGLKLGNDHAPEQSKVKVKVEVASPTRNDATSSSKTADGFTSAIKSEKSKVKVKVEVASLTRNDAASSSKTEDGFTSAIQSEKYVAPLDNHPIDNFGGLADEDNTPRYEPVVWPSKLAGVSSDIGEHDNYGDQQSNEVVQVNEDHPDGEFRFEENDFPYPYLDVHQRKPEYDELSCGNGLDDIPSPPSSD